jgi:FkbM family methyltransferase
MNPRWNFLLLPYTRHELPGWGYLLSKLNILGNQNDYLWTSTGKQTVKGKWHKYSMELDLSDWSERMTYFLGRYYELNTQLLLNHILKEGDRFIDIGANIGMIALHAASLVKKTGQVECFEPNPECAKIIRDTFNANSISQGKVYEIGLSDTKGRLKLNLTSSHTGTATLASFENEKNLVCKTFDVNVEIGDEVILDNQKAVKLIKIDVEGFELRVLKGLEVTLKTWRPCVVTEFVKEHLERAGTSRKEIADFMSNLDYHPYAISTCRKYFKHKLQLTPLRDIEQTASQDILWVYKNNLTFTHIY